MTGDTIIVGAVGAGFLLLFGIFGLIYGIEERARHERRQREAELRRFFIGDT